ncbi:uncharacterized protein LOC131378634 [Hirundo rustica]|uniref:uncharacterized protein LOC131378634 n=1 Tax=Hirundo rustica TaxID=43150 RepID=UPI002672119F|nr:uncharacterized protein LOC131378634 [Hirundo rustica]
MRQMLKEMLQGQPVRQGHNVLKARFPGGSSGSKAAPSAGREAMPRTVTGDLDPNLLHLEKLVKQGLRILALGEDEPVDEDDPVDEGDLDSQPISITEPLEDAEGVAAGRTFPALLVDTAHKPSSHGRDPLRRKEMCIGDSGALEEPKHLDQILSEPETQHDAAGTTAHADNTWNNMRRAFCWGPQCLIKIMAIVAAGSLFLITGCAGIWYCWKRKWHILEEKLNASDWFSDLYSLKSYSSSSEPD